MSARMSVGERVRKELTGIVVGGNRLRRGLLIFQRTARLATRTYQVCPHCATVPSAASDCRMGAQYGSPFVVLHYLSPPELTCATIPYYNGNEIHGGGEALVEDGMDGRSCAGRHVARAATGGKEVEGEEGRGPFQHVWRPYYVPCAHTALGFENWYDL
jgi:hypothetical protein